MPDNPEEFKRFVKLAREVGADEPGAGFECLFDKVAGDDRLMGKKPRVAPPKRRRP